MSAHELGRRGTTGSLAHLVPQGNGRVRVVAGTSGQLQADQVSLVLVLTAIGQGHQQVDAVVAQGNRLLGNPEQGRDLLAGTQCVLLGHRLATVLTQGVGDLVPHHRGDFIVGQLQLLDQA